MTKEQAKALSVNDIKLSVRAANCLNNSDISTVYDLATKTIYDLYRMRNMGRRSIDEISEKLKELGLHFAMKDSEWQEPDLMTAISNLSFENTHRAIDAISERFRSLGYDFSFSIKMVCCRDRLVMSRAEAAHALCVGDAKLNEFVKEGLLRVVKYDSKHRGGILISDVFALVDKCTQKVGK